MSAGGPVVQAGRRELGVSGGGLRDGGESEPRGLGGPQAANLRLAHGRLR